MTSNSLFKLLAPASADNHYAAPIQIFFNDTPLSVASGRSVAAALLAAGVSRFRSTPVSGSPRAPYCMMGACFECLVEINGVPGRQACLVNVHEGMRIHSQEGARDLSPPLTNGDTINASTGGRHGS